MEAVGRLVGLDTDETGLGAVDGGEEGVEVDVLELRRKRLLQRLVPVEPERPAATHEVLPRSALRLVEPERRRACQRRSLERRGAAECVVAVPCLVHRSPERAETRLVVARCHAHVAVGERRAERVHGGIEAVRTLLESERREHALCELLLAVGRKRLFLEERGVDRRRLAHELDEHRPNRLRTPRRPRTSACAARSRRGAACTASRPTRSSRRSVVSGRDCAVARGGSSRSRSFARASIQTWFPSAAARVISTRSSVGTRRSFSQSRRVTRIRLASSESYSSDSSSGRRRSRRRPISSSTIFSCAIRLNVASASARAGWPPGGIVTF